VAEDTVHRSEVEVRTSDATLVGDLALPESPGGLVLFAHGSGSSRLSPRNRAVAGVLNDARLATLLFDLLTPSEHLIDQRTAELRFDIPLLAARLTGAVDWVATDAQLRALPLGLFGASTGAAAALIAAAERPEQVRAVVSRGGRPDLAEEALPKVRCPVLLIVGGRDSAVIDMNRGAAEKLRCEQRLEIVPGATHLFEEPGKLEVVEALAAQWFRVKLGGPA
jgi:putative phosphoribosyl transferase